MTEQHQNLETDQTIQAGEQTSQNDANDSANLRRQARSVVSEAGADRKRSTGGIDSLGGGRLP
ncbi:hypothetical protein C1X59_27685 [Pseudomonas sp. FW215-R2]|uniref:hypothetical protein n=1 Tax=unclassified Pseudomonas TaxID=196821 RepID=UPI000C88090F|nr:MULTISPECIES: hypothetical protein [unclassified Pseudomonas]PMW94865.1 hypothetical protein C1X59_27685 [Pseudomonas sp. FW215-R2]PMX05460.1 hypothetical protein C1X60_27780 [Pseudomonas sp. FW215-L1]PMX18014.1 hypothetical protein C1X57_27200 [Pseudomonas sp. FW215-E1]PNA31051.1 hypothetical protein C1X58_09255 [Pseudomonas sp. FW215-R4]